MALARIWRCSSPVNVKKFVLRKYASETSGCVKKGLVLGVYTGEGNDGKDVLLTAAAKQFDCENGGSLMKHIQMAGPGLKKGKVRIFYGLNRCYPIVAVVGLGKPGLGYNQLEEIDEGKEAIRSAAAAASRSLQDLEVTEVIVENLGNAEAAVEGATLGLFCYQQHKNKKKRKVVPEVNAFEGESEGWRNGKIAANAQNVARMLSDTPSNLMTPSVFAKSAKQLLSIHDVELMVHDKCWAKERSMGAFLSVARGSKEPPVFLEMSYMNGPKDQKPIVFVGKGVTFDSGGISLKPAANMDHMRADMGGAACVVATMLAVAQIKLPVNLIGLIPLCENMPSGSATKPGDVVTAMNGKTIQVDNTDAEGRLILADALCYASTFDPMLTVDIATLTGAMRIALGGAATGVFTNSPDLWQKIQKAGSLTGDRVWRFPLWDAYTKLMTDYPAVDINNVGQGKGGGACTAAAFLKEFAPEGQWMHLDIAGVMGPSPDNSYLQKGMTGRPTRTLIQLVSQYSQNEEE